MFRLSLSSSVILAHLVVKIMQALQRDIGTVMNSVSGRPDVERNALYASAALPRSHYLWDLVM